LDVFRLPKISLSSQEKLMTEAEFEFELLTSHATDFIKFISERYMFRQHRPSATINR
jgi:hypothetical protein